MNAPTTRQNSRGTSRTLHIPIYWGGGRGVTSHAHLTKCRKNLVVTNLFRNFAPSAVQVAAVDLNEFLLL